MYRGSTPFKHGISKPKNAKEHQMLKKSIRYFSLDGPDDTGESSSTSHGRVPASTSQMFFNKRKKRKIEPYDGDVTHKLLDLVSQTANVTNVHAIKQTIGCSEREKKKLEQNLKNGSSTKTFLSSVQRDVNMPKEVIKKTLMVDREKTKGRDLVQNIGNYVVMGMCNKEIRNQDKSDKDAYIHPKINVKQYTLRTQEVEQQNNDIKMSAGERSSTFENTSNRQGIVKVVAPKVVKNDSSSSKNSTKDLNDTGHKVENQIKKLKKKCKSSRESKLLLGDKEEKSNKTYVQEEDKYQDNYKKQPKEKRPSSIFENSLMEQETDNHNITTFKNSFEAGKSIKGLKQSGYKIDNHIKKLKKKPNSSGESQFMKEIMVESNNKTIQTVDSSKDKNPETCLISSTLVKGEHSSKRSKSEKKCRSSIQNFSLELNNKDEKKEACSVIDVRNNLSLATSETDNDNQKVKKKKKKKISSEKKINYHQDNKVSGQNIINSDEHVEKNPSPLKRVQQSAKKKNKQSDITDKHLGIIDNSCIEQHPKIHSKELKENCSENEEEGASNISATEEHDVKISKKHRKIRFEVSQKKFCNSQPILVEMSGNNVPYNPLSDQVSDLNRQKVPVFKLKSDLTWKPQSSSCSSGRWEVQYGKSSIEQQLEMENEESESDIRSSEVEISATDHARETASGEHSFGYSYHAFVVSETKVLLTLPVLSSVVFQGAFKVKVILGRISVLGYETSHEDDEAYTVYSSRGENFLSIEALESEVYSSKEKYWEVFSNINCLSKEVKKSVTYNASKPSTLLLLESVSENCISFLQRFFKFQTFPFFHNSIFHPDEYSSRILRAKFMKSSTVDKYRQPSVWKEILPNIMTNGEGEMRMMACGGKGVGKSTFLRFLVNQTLSIYSNFEKVMYIDFDIGQCEFSAPGCVSAVLVENPLLGSNFTHLTQPQRMVYVGEVNASVCPEHYLKCVQYILDWCFTQPELSKLPWFINTMGFAKGLGVDLTIAIIKMVNPTNVVQIQSSNWKQNFPFDLEFAMVKGHESNLPSVVDFQNKELHPFRFLKIETAAEEAHPSRLNANAARDRVLLSYFSQVVAPPAISLLEVAPHVLPFSSMKLCISRGEVKYSDYLSAMNASLVALCRVNNISSLKPNEPGYPEILQNIPVCHCLGFGIVRGVDIEKKKFFIITPLKTEEVETINCLVLGSVALPEELLTNQDGANGFVPYVVSGAMIPLAQEVKV